MNAKHERENVGMAFNRLAQQAVGLRRVLIEAMQSTDMHEQGALLDAAIHGVEYMGLISDTWADQYGAPQSVGGLNDWAMPPIFNRGE